MTIFKSPVFTYTFILLTAIFTFAGVAYSWTSPSGTAPNNNVSAPINVGGTSQIKNGGLGASALAVYGNSYVQGNLGIGVASPAQKLDISGNVRATAFLYSSDNSQKHDIKTIENATDIIKSLRGVTFSWNKDNRASAGLIAQEVEEVLPELVHTDPATGLKSVEYANLVAPLIEALKEQQKEIEILKRQVSELQNEVNTTH